MAVPYHEFATIDHLRTILTMAWPWPYAPDGRGLVGAYWPALLMKLTPVQSSCSYCNHVAQTATTVPRAGHSVIKESY